MATKSKTRQIDVTKKVSGLENALTEPYERDVVEFEWYGKNFTTLNRIPAMVMHRNAVLTDEESTVTEQLEALIYSVEHILQPEDRRKFIKVMEDEGVDFTELYIVYANIIEAITTTPLEESSSSPTGSKSKTAGKSRMGTFNDGDVA